MIGKAALPPLVVAMSTAQANGASATDTEHRNLLVGQFTFTEDGHTSVHIMHNPPDPENAVVDCGPDPDACMPGWYCGYFGIPYGQHRGRDGVTHIVGGNNPACVGTDQMRAFKLEGDQLLISESYMSGDAQVPAERVPARDEGI